MERDDELTQGHLADFVGAVKVVINARVLPTCFVLGPHEFEDPLEGLHLSFAQILANPEAVEFTPPPAPVVPTTVAELAGRWDWELTEYYCLYCGQQPVIQETGDGDFYHGPRRRCLTCQDEF